MKISARNQFKGKIIDIEEGASEYKKFLGKENF